MDFVFGKKSCEKHKTVFVSVWHLSRISVHLMPCWVCPQHLYCFIFYLKQAFSPGESHTILKHGPAQHEFWCSTALIIVVNTLKPWQNGRHFPDDIFTCIYFSKNVRILIRISLKFVPKGPINNIPALVQIMAWRHPGDRPLYEPMMVSLPMHICHSALIS